MNQILLPLLTLQNTTNGDGRTPLKNKITFSRDRRGKPAITGAPGETKISNQTVATTRRNTAYKIAKSRTKPLNRLFRRLIFKPKRRSVKYAIISANVVLLIGIAMFVFSDYSEVSGSTGSNTQPLISSADNEEPVNPLDSMSSVNVAVHVARMTKLDEATSVANKADTVTAQEAVTPADDQVIAKPQVISTNLKTRKDIRTYVSKSGDTVNSVADKFNVSANTIRYSNNLDGESIPNGKTLLISPVNGIVYRVKAGDTPQSLATKFLVDKEQLIAFNDAELTGKFKVGELIIIPDGTQPSSVSRLASVNTASSTTTDGSGGGYGFAYGGGGPVYGGGGYDYGYCTYWAALRRAQIGRPIPSNLGNAVSWRDLAISAGFPVGSNPRQGAVIWFPSIGGYGHVGFVEKVNPSGSFTISEMNYQGWSVRDERTFSASEASNYRFIY